MELKLQIVQRQLRIHTPTSLLILLLPLHQQCSKTMASSFSLSSNPNPNDSPFHLLRWVHARYRRWDSNAETFRAQNFNFNPQNNDEDDDDDNDDDDDDDWLGVLEEFIEGAWIVPVFRSFGWMLPAIISSLLLTSGPKAFLMALAIPLGQSALSLAFQKISGRKSSKPKRKARTKPKPRVRYSRNVKLEEEEAAKSEGTRKGTMGYQTWVAGDDVRGEKDSQDSPSFGGWDELDRQTKFNKGSARKSAQNADGPQRSKLSRRGRESEMPLLLRLLIAVFPFLGSWTKFF